ncbi:Asp-tRNA(Asn)/Glu-tRNA(Gln) amidotransferase subunit GatC [Clostridium niameyense]|uniref:Aspartyl/glutamyl-tRNA(Asn/Gln) amidotransferase subunit C n=1 Tax=Clostridium niameyense TaxID=1622073 RepID=A0A6M0RB92_9CLOT|nr:Asp-tRNA(Asn)/Glu-tRNA(Gln) amidotransferase subunit GatC [Clostridium niameyense]NEZ46829.1 Asp-tRNA(Asn)/Glu-tRNA(Gln) amidotransferase subunit GatC [Clostridium niameyense]
MSVSKKDVEYVAELAKLEFNEEQKEEFVDDLNKILTYMEKLDELDTNDVDIIVNPYYIENKYREDEVQESMKLNDVIENSPDHLEEYIIVPKVID